MKCAPSRKSLSYSCYTDFELRKILQHLKLQINESREKNVETLRRYFAMCPDERCWLKQIGKGVVDETKIFKPMAQWGSNGWLSNFEIDEALSQYEEVYSDFAYLGTCLMDFLRQENKYGPKLSHLISKRNKRRFALVLNLYGIHKDAKFKKHWVALYVDLPKRSLEYFDSSMFKIQPDVWKVIVRLILGIKYIWLADKENKEVNFFYNAGKPVQTKDGDCGVYVIDFITQRLSGKSYLSYLKEAHDEQRIKKVRDDSFNIPK